MRLSPSICLSLSLSLVSLSLAPAAPAQVPAQPPARTLIRAGHLLDVHTGKLLDAETIIVTGDKITAIAATASTPAAAGDAVVDLGSLTVLPGLIDAHTHITSNPEFDPYKELTGTDAKEAINGVVNARTTPSPASPPFAMLAPAATSTWIFATPSTRDKSPARICWSAARRSASPAATATKTCSPSPTTKSPTE